jgi:hypothetical protein
MRARANARPRATAPALRGLFRFLLDATPERDALSSSEEEGQANGQILHLEKDVNGMVQ